MTAVTLLVTRDILFVFAFCVFPLCYRLVVSTSAIDCVERLVSEMTCYVSSGMLNHTHSLTHCSNSVVS